MLWLVVPVPNTRFLQGKPAGPGHKHHAAGGRQREAGCMPMGALSLIQLSLKVKVQKSSRHAVRPRGRASERQEGAGKAAWVRRLYSVLRPPVQAKAHGTRHLRKNGDADLSSRVRTREVSRQQKP